MDLQPQQMHVCALQIYKDAIPRALSSTRSAYMKSTMPHEVRCILLYSFFLTNPVGSTYALCHLHRLEANGSQGAVDIPKCE